MPSPLVNRYAVFVHMPGIGKVREPIARDPSLFLAVESCLSGYELTGHDSYVIEDQRPARAFTLTRKYLLAFVFLRAHHRDRYFEVLNHLDRFGDQPALESMLAEYVPV